MVNGEIVFLGVRVQGVPYKYVRPIKYYYSFLLQIFNIIHSIKLHIRAPLRHTEIITVSEYPSGTCCEYQLALPF